MAWIRPGTRAWVLAMRAQTQTTDPEKDMSMGRKPALAAMRPYKLGSTAQRMALATAAGLRPPPDPQAGPQDAPQAGPQEPAQEPPQAEPQASKPPRQRASKGPPDAPQEPV